MIRVQSLVHLISLNYSPFIYLSPVLFNKGRSGRRLSNDNLVGWWGTPQIWNAFSPNWTHLVFKLSIILKLFHKKILTNFDLYNTGSSTTKTTIIQKLFREKSSVAFLQTPAQNIWMCSGQINNKLSLRSGRLLSQADLQKVSQICRKFQKVTEAVRVNFFLIKLPGYDLESTYIFSPYWKNLAKLYIVSQKYTKIEY